MLSTLAQTTTDLAVGRKPAGESRAFSARRPGGLRRNSLYMALCVGPLG